MTKRIDERVAFLSTRRQVLMAGAAAGAVVLLPTMSRVARAATASYSLECDRSSAFIMDPNEHKRVGYLTDFNGLGLASALPRDLVVVVPWGPAGSAAPSYAGLSASPAAAGSLGARVTGVIEKFSWAGGVGDALQIDAWVSQQTATQLKVQQQSMKNTKVSSLGWWIVDYDQETKTWYEQAYPITPVKVGGALTSAGLSVDMTGSPAKAGIDVMVYKVSLQVAPGANQTSTLHFGSSSKAPVVKTWGLTVGTLAGKAGL